MARFVIRDSSRTHLAGFSLDWLPPWAYQYITPSVSRDSCRIELEAGPAVGTIPLLNGDVLWIVPRSGQYAFSRMLLVSEGLDDSVQSEIEEEAALGVSDGDSSLTSLLARPFVTRLISLEKNSLAPMRQPRQEWRSSVRGNLDALRTSMALARGEQSPALCTFWEKSYDSAEHRVLGAAAMQLFYAGDVPQELRSVAGRWADFVRNRRLRRSELHSVVVGLSRSMYSGFRAYYTPALVMARMILSHAAVGFESNDVIASQALLTNMPLLFERYVRRLVSLELSSLGYVVEKVESGAKARRLFTDGTGDLLPDILVTKGGLSVLVADAKYKPGRSLDAANYYQISTYLQAYGCTTGVLVLPADKSAATSTTTRRVFWNSCELHEVRMGLSDVTAAERFLRSFVRNLAA
jgi:5-methylcytosine-specific restriction enzyme subunit McrC